MDPSNGLGGKSVAESADQAPTASGPYIRQPVGDQTGSLETEARHRTQAVCQRGVDRCKYILQKALRRTCSPGMRLRSRCQIGREAWQAGAMSGYSLCRLEVWGSSECPTVCT